jgi:A118 family predicted phage portal protein
VPLPIGGKTPWPPHQLQPVQARMSTWSAWYSGDPDQLSSVYGGQVGNDPGNTGFFASQRGGYPRGGMAGFFQRMWWGRRTPQGEQRTKLHIPIAGDIAATSANLLFSEPPTITVEGARTQARLDKLTRRLKTALLEAAEVQAALGGVYLRVCWDREQRPDGPWISAVHADAAVPEWCYDALGAVTFWRIVDQDGDTVWRHLERHEPGTIAHGLYKGDTDTLGTRMALEDHPATADLADEQLLPGDIVPTGVDGRLTAVYVPNMRPNRLWRASPAAAYLGRSDFAGIEPAMDSFDEVWSSWMRDIRLGKGRAVVPESYLESNGPGRGARWEADREVYETLNMLPQPGGPAQLEVVQFSIRVEEHSRTAAELLSRIISDAGYSLQSFGLDSATAATATEVNSRDRKSETTRGRKQEYWRPELAEILETLQLIDAAQFGSGITAEEPDIEWPDAAAQDPESVARTLQLLQAAEAASTRTKVQMLHPDWDEGQVDAEVDLIQGETGRSVEDPGTFTGGPIGVTGQQLGNQLDQQPVTVDGLVPTPVQSPASG